MERLSCENQDSIFERCLPEDREIINSMEVRGLGSLEIYGWFPPPDRTDKMTSQIIVRLIANSHRLLFQLVTGPLEPGMQFRIRDFKRRSHTI